MNPDEAAIDGILLQHRNEAFSISRGESDGLDIGTSAAKAKAQIQQLIALARIDELEQLDIDQTPDDYQVVLDRIKQLKSQATTTSGEVQSNVGGDDE